MTGVQLDTAVLTAARRAVADACRVCRWVQRDIQRAGSITKDDRSPVTVADFASQAIVAHRLGQVACGTGVSPVLADPSLRLVAEENADALRDRPDLLERVVAAVRRAWPDARAADVLDAIDRGGWEGGAGSFWTLDPIDGTKGFLRGQQYAVSLAKIERGQPVLGLLGCPNLSTRFDRPFDDADPVGVIYLARLDAGVIQLPADDPEADPTPIHRPAYDPDAPIRLCESVEKSHSSHDASAMILDRLGRTSDPQRLDSQCKYAVVARGQADAYLRMPTKKGYIERIWDHAAGAIVASEAGCVVTDIRGEPLDFAQGRGLERNLGVVCAPEPLHGELIAAIESLNLAAPPAAG